MKEIFELINPSDPFTLEGEREACCAAAMFLGNGRYGLNAQDDKQAMPVMIFGINEELNDFWRKSFGHLPDDYIPHHKAEIAAALDSLMLGDFGDREFIGTLNADQKRAWTERKRSSLSNIAKRAEHYADILRKQLAETGR